MRIQKFAKFLLITIGILLTTQSGFAGESGTYKAISIQSYDYTNFEHFGQKIVGGPLKGVVAVLESSSAPFLAGDYSAVQCMALAKSSDQGVHLESPCTVTDKSGDKYYALAVRKREMLKPDHPLRGIWSFWVALESTPVCMDFVAIRLNICQMDFRFRR